MSLRKMRNGKFGEEEEKKKKRGSFSSLWKKSRKSIDVATEEGHTSLLLKRFGLKRNHDPVFPPVGEPTQTYMDPSKGEDSVSTPDPVPDPAKLPREELSQRVLEVLSEVLMGGTAGSLEPEAGSLLKAWRENKPVLPQKVGSGLGHFPGCWLHQFQQQVEKSVKLHFPALPAEVSAKQQSPQPQTYLRQVQEVVQRELLRLAPVLKEMELLGTVIDRYHSHTISQLELLLQKNLNSDQTFTLLHWALHTYLSDELLGQRDLHSDVSKHIDFLLFTECVQRTRDYLLQTAEAETEVCLQRILHGSGTGVCDRQLKDTSVCDVELEKAGVSKDPVEETTQCVKAFLQRAQDLSPILVSNLQSLFSAQLQQFVQRYVTVEKKRLLFQMNLDQTVVVHLYNTCNTCTELRLLLQLASEAQSGAATPDAVVCLDELEGQAKERLLQAATDNAEAALKTYFKGAAKDLGEVRTKIKQLFVPIPLVKDTHTHRVLVDLVYQNITSLYVHHLLLSDRSQLERRWGDVGKRLRNDAEGLHETFTQQDANVERRCVCLQKVGEVLESSDVNTLKLILIELITECPNISNEEQLNVLLRWKGGLSRQQMTEVMDAIMECCPRQPPSESSVKAPPISTSPFWCHVLPCLRPPITT